MFLFGDLKLMLGGILLWNVVKVFLMRLVILVFDFKCLMLGLMEFISK